MYQDIKNNIDLGGNLQMELLLPCDTELSKLSEELKLTLYRIIQEQVNNTLKHAKATAIAIKMQVKENYVFLSIEDNGTGTDFNNCSKGIGLRNIQSRVNLYEGEIEVTTAPNQGFKLITKIPLI